MKALFVHDHKFPRDKSSYYYSYGFDESFFSRYLNIFTSFEILGREVKVEQDNYAGKKIIDDKVSFFTLSGYSNLLSKKIRLEIKEKIKTVDALVVRLPSNLGLYAIQIAKDFDKPYLIELVGCPWDSYWYMGFKRKPFAPLMAYMTKRALQDSKYSVYVTEEFLQNRYPTTGKSIACSNVMIKDTKKDDLNNRINKISSYAKEKKIIFGTVGTIDSIYKGQHYILKAIKQLTTAGYNVEYQLVGGGDNTFLRNLAINYNVERNVKFIGKLPHEEVFNWLKHIDIYVQPSDTEGLPRSVIEAMSVSCPVIGSNAGGIPELINNSVIFSKGNTDEFLEIFYGLTKEKMINLAQENHHNSKKYLKKSLFDKREAFFKEFIKNEM